MLFLRMVRDLTDYNVLQLASALTGYGSTSSLNGTSGLLSGYGVTTNTQATFAQALSAASAQSNSTSSGATTYIETPMDSIFEAAAAKYNLPVNLLKAVAKAESNFNTTAVSRCGAQGVMQLMPATAKYLGVTDPFDAEQNIFGGARYLSELLGRFNGNIEFAVAGYNAGGGAVEKYGGIPPYKETQNYVKKVMEYLGTEITTGKTVSTAASSQVAGATNTTSTTKIVDKTTSSCCCCSCSCSSSSLLNSLGGNSMLYLGELMKLMMLNNTTSILGGDSNNSFF